jgi:N-6 DNA Methylase
MSRSSRNLFQTIRSEGGLLPADLLQRVAQGDRELGGVRAEDYHLRDLPLNEAIVRSWNRLVGAWVQFRDARRDLPEGDPGTTLTRERWLLVFFEELRFGRLQTARAVEIDGKSYPVSHAWDHVPIHLVGCNVSLEKPTPGVAGAARQNPHGLLQELLNRSEERLWGFVSNGLVLRLLRDNSSFTRQAYLEFDLEQMMESEAYSDFVLLWLTCHQSRVEGENAYKCRLEEWSQEAARQGTRALDSLRAGVETAIRELGTGFLTPGRNPELRDALRSGALSTQDYYRQLLRLVYRLLFLFVAEDRGLLHDPRASDTAKERYDHWYSTRRLRDLAQRRRGTKHGDLWDGLRLIMAGLGSDDGCTPLGLPALGSFLWSGRALSNLDRAQLPNRALLEAVRALATVRDGKVLRAVDYKNLGAEELGSVYESLLELHPELDADAGTFALRVAAGSERKTTGSYYTPTSLISELLDSALDPVLEEAAATGEDTILELKVVDPACGSGHFLVAAAHRIAKRLATARTGDEEPSPEATRHALRDVVSRCIYGVDLNPMAVELCKVSLWMEALDPGRPLSFLDAHIKCGNSLLGTKPALVAGGIPDGAFKSLEGDQKAVATELRKRNRHEQTGQLTLEDEVARIETELRERALGIERSGDSSPEELRVKEERYRKFVESPPYERARLLADTWCAAFVQRKTASSPQITQRTLRLAAEAPERLAPETRAEIEALRNEYAFFHWHVEFPQVFRTPEREAPDNDQAGWSGGFDCVLGNPPWERVKLQEKEFFASSPEIATAPTAAIRKRLIADLSTSDPRLHAAWLAALRKADGGAHFLRASGGYPLTGRGDVNTYAVFAELDRILLSQRGRAGIICPSGLLLDKTTRDFFASLVTEHQLVSAFEFENEGFFIGIGQGHMVRFCLLTISSRGIDRPPEFLFQGKSLAELADTNRRLRLTADDIATVNPISRTCPIFRTRRDAELVTEIYRELPILQSATAGWQVRYVAMFHMAGDSQLFESQSTDENVRLYEAKMINLYNHRFGDFSAVPLGGSSHVLPPVPLEYLDDPDYRPAPRHYVPRREVAARLNGWTRAWLFGWRDVTDARASARSVIFSVLPRVGAGHNLPVMLPEVDAAKAAALYANLASFVFDYIARQKIGGLHLTIFILDQLPVVPAEQYDQRCGWASDVALREWVVPRVLELVCTAGDVSAFAAELGYDGQPFKWDAQRRFLLRSELDAAFFHLYGLARDDVDHVMDTFPIVRDRDVKAHGEYRTRGVILEIYDELAKAIETGEPYQTRLDPPPADPRVAHPPRTEEPAVSVARS